jgi:hypothetical protein
MAATSIFLQEIKVLARSLVEAARFVPLLARSSMAEKSAG